MEQVKKGVTIPEHVISAVIQSQQQQTNTLFRKVKFGIRKAFFICFEMSMTNKSLSASYMADHFGVTENTRLFMHKV